MYGSYGSYSSMSAASAPMDITSSNLQSHDATCAFPSWPRRYSLSDDSNNGESRPTSFLSDDDLFLSDPFEDDASSVSSGSSSTHAVSLTSTLAAQQQPQLTEAELMEMERERLAMQREYVRGIIAEKERRSRQQNYARRQFQTASPSSHRKSSPATKKSPKSKLSAMTSINEAK